MLMRLRKISALALATCVFLFIYWEYFSLEKLLFHDSVVLMTSMHLAITSILSGHLPLWTPYLNAGQPLWPQVESAPSFDPIALIIYFLYSLFGSNGAYAFQYICFAWFFVFSLGVFVLASRLTKYFVLAVFSYFSFLAGPLFLSIIFQAQGYLAPFRYAPWAILAFLKFREKPSMARVLAFGLILGISSAGYQSNYCYTFLALFFLLYHFHSGDFRRPLVSLLRSYLGAFVTCFLILLPTIFAGFEWLRLFPVARVYYNNVTSPDYFEFLRSFWNFYPPQETEIGYQGIVPLLLFPFFIVSFIFNKKIRASLSPLARTWLSLTPILLALYFGVDSIRSSYNSEFVFLGLRNWSFVYPLVYWGVSQIFLIVLDWVVERALSCGPVNLSLGIGRTKEWGILAFLIIILAIPFLFEWKRITELHFTIGEQILWAGSLLGLIFGFAKRGLLSETSISVLLFVFCFADLAIFSFTQAQWVNSLNNNSELVQRMPVLRREPKPVFPSHREAYFDIFPYLPYHYEGPSVRHVFSVSLIPNPFIVDPPIKSVYPITSITHQFREPRYHNLRQPKLSEQNWNELLGVTTPLLEADPLPLAVKDFSQAITALKQRDDERLCRRLIVEWPGSASKSLENLEDKCALSPVQEAKSLKVNILEYSPSNLVLDYEATRSELFVWREAWSPAWTALVDGKPHPILLTDGYAKGVWLEPGQHRVQFSYRPTGYLIAFWIRFAVILGGVIVLSRKNFLRNKGDML
jgi:hypothetical protein